MVLVAGLLAASAVFAQALKAIPPLSARVIDITGTLQGAEKSQIEAKLQAFEQSRGTQIVVLMVPTTLPEDIVDYTQRVGDLWKIGRREVGDGLLLVIAKNDRTLRIAPAKTLEGAVPDLAARRVIDTAITPRFKQGDFAGGISAGLDQLMALISGERLPEPPRATAGSGAEAADWQGRMVFLFVAVPVAARLLSLVTGRKLGSLLTGGAVGALAWWLVKGGAHALSQARACSVRGAFSRRSGK